LFAVWLIVQPHIIDSMVIAALPADVASLPPDRLGLVMNDIRNLAAGDIARSADDPAIRAAAEHYRSLRATGHAALSVVVLALAVAGAAFGLRRVTPTLRARNIVESVLMVVLVISSTIAIFTTVGIVLSLLFEAIRFFHYVPWYEFLFGLDWSPQTAIHADQVGQSGSFGAVPVFVGTAVITVIAMMVSVPVGLFSAIYLAEFADRRVRATVKPVLEILAGIPTVVYGFIAALTVAPAIRDA